MKQKLIIQDFTLEDKPEKRMEIKIYLYAELWPRFKEAICEFS